MEIKLSEMQPLTAAQYDAAKASALARIEKRIGARPQRAAFERDSGQRWTILDVLALLVFAAALLISSVHIISHMGALASSAHSALDGGIIVPLSTYTVVHQVGFIVLAESAMILFFVLHSINAREQRGWRRYISIPLLLALVAMLFVIVANVQSGIGVLESIMPPVFTVGIGFHLERLIVVSLANRSEVQRRYLDALRTWEAATADATLHPDYRAVLRQEVWSKLIGLKRNQAFVDAPARFKVAAAESEIARERWSYGHDAIDHYEGGTAPAAPPVPFGSTAAAQGGHESTPMIAHVNGRGGEYIAAN